MRDIYKRLVDPTTKMSYRRVSTLHIFDCAYSRLALDAYPTDPFCTLRVFDSMYSRSMQLMWINLSQNFQRTLQFNCFGVVGYYLFGMPWLIIFLFWATSHYQISLTLCLGHISTALYNIGLLLHDTRGCANPRARYRLHILITSCRQLFPKRSATHRTPCVQL